MPSYQGAPLAGLSGLYGPPSQEQQYMDEGVLEAHAAPGTATSHSEYGSQSLGYGGTVPPISPQDTQEAYDAGTDQAQYWSAPFDAAGAAWIDQTPTTHNVPWPKGIAQMSWEQPNGAAVANEQMQLLHGTDDGGVEHYVLDAYTAHEEPTHYSTDDYTAPNESMLAKIPDQLKGSNGPAGSALQGGGGHVPGGNAGGSNADPDQGYGVVNTLPEFNAGHSIRRIQHDNMPMDYTLTHGEGIVPFLGRHDLVGQMSFDGPDSPYYAAGSIDGNQIPWEGRMGNPAPYVQPPEVTVGPALSNDPSTDIYAWG
jgi:hypothetical protein